MIQNALTSIAARPPQLPDTLLRELLAEHYGLQGAQKALISERDQNTRVTLQDGRRFVFKIANATEEALVTDFQVQALQHLARNQPDADVPRIQKTLAGAATFVVEHSAAQHVARLVSFVDGDMMSAHDITTNLARSLGQKLAALDEGLVDFEHAGDSQLLLWDMQRAGELHSLLPHIDDSETARTVVTALQDFEQHGRVAFDELRHQVIHGDANTGNVVLSDDNQAVRGFIDFGDMIRAPLIVDVAIAAAYLRVEEGDPVALIAAFVDGYQQVVPLTALELEILYFLVRTRLATTVAILYWRLADREVDDPYRQQSLASEAGAIRFLKRLDKLGWAGFQARVSGGQ